jgi:hypothetical protein
MKKIYITLGTLLLATMVMAYLYFSSLNQESNANDLALHSVSSEAGIIFSFENDKSFYEILSGQDLLQNVLGERKSKLLKNLHENLLSFPSVFKAIDGQKSYIGIVPVADSLAFIIATQLKKEAEPTKLLGLLNSSKIHLKKEGSHYVITFADSTQVFLQVKEKVVLLSNSSVALHPASTDKLAATEDFAEYVKANSRFNKNTLANLYFDFNKMPAFLKNCLNSNLTGELSLFSKQNSYAALSYSFSKDKLLFNGVTTINDPKNYFSLFTNLPEQQLTIDNILPAKTANYAIYAVTDYPIWQKEFTNWLDANAKQDKIKKQVDAINEKYRVDLRQLIAKYFKNQFVTFQLQSGEKFGAIALSNGDKFGQLLLDLSAPYAPDVRIFKESKIPYSFFGQPFEKFERPFYTIIDNYLVMANNASSIQVFLSSYQADQLLINEKDYVDFSDQLSAAATLSFYVNHQNSGDIFSRNLKMPYYKQYRSKDGWQQYHGFCYQLSGDHGKFLSNILLDKKRAQQSVTDTTTLNP